LSLDKTPSVSGSLAYAHKWFVAGNAVIEARLSSKYSGSYLVSDFVGAQQYTQKSFTRSDFALSYTSGSGKFDLQAFIRDIEDKLQYIGAPGSISPTVVDSATVGISEPRTFGVRAGVKF
jgi:iron complex outermembrane receptor protein